MKKFTIFLAAIALVCFSVPAMAVDWNFYGNTRVATFWESRDFDDTTNPGGTDDEESELDWNFQANSRLGVNVRADHIRAQVEMGLSGADDDQVRSDSYGNDGQVTTRQAWARWNFGAGYLQVGKSYTPVTTFVSGQVGRRDAGLIGFGAPYGGRPGNLQLSIGGFNVALITPRTDVPLTSDDAAGTPVVGDDDPVIPKIEASWGMSRDTWNFKIFGGFQYYSIEDVPSQVAPGTTEDLDVTSYIIGGSGGVNFGAFYISGQLMNGQNMGNDRWSGGAFDSAGFDGDDDTDDVDSFGGVLVAGFKFSDMLTIEAGFGYVWDDPNDADIRDEETEAFDVYVQGVIQLAPGVFIIPEVGFASFGNNPSDLDQGSDWYAGGK